MENKAEKAMKIFKENPELRNLVLTWFLVRAFNWIFFAIWFGLTFAVMFTSSALAEFPVESVPSHFLPDLISMICWALFLLSSGIAMTSFLIGHEARMDEFKKKLTQGSSGDH